MKLWIKLAMVGLIALMIFAACGSDDKDNNGPANPATTTGTTNANGEATLSVGSYSVDATVTNVDHTGLANIGLTAYLSQDNVVVVAVDPAGTRYPSIVTAALASSAKMGGQSRIQSPDDIAKVALDANIIMYPVQLGVYSFDPEPNGIDEFISNSWTVETWHDGTLSDLYNLTDSVTLYTDFAFMHLSQAVATAMGTSIRTAVFVPDEIADFPTFASLFGYTFHIFEGDTLHFATISYNNGGFPMLYIDNVVAHRDFWGQFTLIWGENPHDLDSHLWTPKYGADSTRYHICYYRRGYQGEAPFADLDVDDVTSFGPEHVTIYEPYTGVYTYAIYHYSGSGTLATSNASVSLLKPNGTVQTFNVPTDTTGVGAHWWWWVCSIDGTTGTVTSINTLHADPPYPDEIAGMPSKPVYTNEQ
jgi:hypothetical protein